MDFFKIKIFIRECIAYIIRRFRVLRYRISGYDIYWDAILERNLNLARWNPKGIHIGKKTLIASGVTILSHYTRFHEVPKYYLTGEKVDTYIGERCFIGTGAYILAGVKIGNNVIVGAGTVVTKDIPDNSIVAGNPGRIIKEKITIENLRI